MIVHNPDIPELAEVEKTSYRQMAHAPFVQGRGHLVDTKPNSLIFSKPKQQDLQPEAVTK